MDHNRDGDCIVVASSPPKKREMTKRRIAPVPVKRQPTPVSKNDANPTPTPAVVSKRAPAPAKDCKRVSENGRNDHAKEMEIDGKFVKADLEEFGFGKQDVGDMVKRKDVSDIYMSGAREQIGAIDDAETKRHDKSQRLEKGKGKSGAPVYEPLYLAKDTNWVLFDPEKGYPGAFNDEPMTKEPPNIIQRFETYQRGNARIVEYNTRSGAVRLRSTPRVLVAREVRYERTGPKLVDIMPPKKGRAVPRDKKEASGLRRVVQSSDVEDAVSDEENRLQYES